MSKTLRRGRGTPSPKKSKSTTTSSVISAPKPRVFVRRQFELPKKPSSSPKKIVKLKKSRKKKKLISGEFIILDDEYSQPNIVTTFLQMLNTVKLYHWKTTSYAQHKATDELYAKLNESIDSFVEIMLGKQKTRVNLTETKSIPLHDYSELTDFEKEIEMYKNYLIGMSSFFDSKLDSDLLNVRDEILGQLNQFTYLLTFK